MLTYSAKINAICLWKKWLFHIVHSYYIYRIDVNAGWVIESIYHRTMDKRAIVDTNQPTQLCIHNFHKKNV